jgi:hypothetical protein
LELLLLIDKVELPDEFKIELFKSLINNKYYYQTHFASANAEMIKNEINEMMEITASNDESAKYQLRIISDLVHEAGLFLPLTA